VGYPWSKALVSVVATGALGAGAVLLTGCGGKASPAPTATASTSTSAAAATTGAAVPSPTGNGGNGNATDGSSGNGDAGTTPTPTTPNGTQLATYSFELPQPYGAPLSTTAPTRVQISAGSGDDVYYNGDISVGSNDQMLSLPAGSTPTFQACSSDTLIGGNQSATRGTAFCIVENGTMAGVTVTSVGTSTSGTNYVVLDVTIWQNTGVTPTSSS
jgi:hypothetical protein